MKTLHSGSLDVISGGPALSMSHTLRGLDKAGVSTVALTEPISQNGKLIGESLNVCFIV